MLSQMGDCYPMSTPKDCLTAVENGSTDCAIGIPPSKLSADRNLLGMNLVVVDSGTAVSALFT